MQRRLGNKPLDPFVTEQQMASPTLEEAKRQEARDLTTQALQTTQNLLGERQGFRFGENIELPGGVSIPTGLNLTPKLNTNTKARKLPNQIPHQHGEITPLGPNGRLDPKSLVDIGGGHKLHPAAAAAWNQMVRAAAKDGVNITITDSYRDLATQERLAKEKGLYSQGGLAAVPGTSNHGLGLAVDVDQGREWLAKHGNKFGFSTIPREPWHWEYKGGGTSPNNKGRKKRR